MTKRTGSNLTTLFCSITFAFLSGNAYSQHSAIDSFADDCMAKKPQSEDADSMAIRLSCYNRKLDNLTQVLSGLISERKRLNEVISNFEKDAPQPLTSETSLVHKQQQTIQHLQLERAELRARLHQLLSEKQPAQLDKETNERLFRNYSEAYAALSIENDELRKLLTEHQASATSYQTTAKALEETNQHQAAQVTKFSDEIANLKLTIADLSSRKKKLANQFAATESRIGLLKNQLLANATTIKHQSDDIATLQQAKNASLTELDVADQTLMRVKEQNAESIEGLIATKEKLYDQIGMLTEDRDRIRNQARQASLNSMATLSDRDKTVSTLNIKLKEFEAAHEEVAARLASTETELTAANEAYQNQVTEKNMQLTQLEQKFAALEKQLEAAINTTANVTQVKNTALDTNADLSDQLQTRMTQIKALQNERVRLAAELNAARPELARLSKSLEIKDAESSDQALTIASLRTEIEQADTARANLLQKLKISEKSNSSANKEVETLSATVTSLESILAESLSSNKHIEASLADIKTNLSASQKRLDSKQSQLQQLMAEKKALIEAHNALVYKSEKLASNIEKTLKAYGVDSVMVTRLQDNSLVLKVNSRQLFRTGSSRLSTQGQDLLLSVGNAIGSIENRQIIIEGHSDNVPLGEKLSAIFKDNLGLSMARALSTAKFFTDSANIPANKISVSGAGATKPMASNDTSEGRQSNRRVEIILLPAKKDEPLASRNNN